MIDTVGAHLLAAIAGLLGGIVLGLASRVGRFCSLGAIEDLLYGGSDQRMRMWALAVGVAVFGCFSLIAAGWLDPMASFYLAQGFSPAAAVIGGLIFGYGMAMAGNCGLGALALLGGGSLRAFVAVLVLGVSSYITLSGPLSHFRVWLFPPRDAPSPAGLAFGLSDLTGVAAPALGLLIGAAIMAAAVAGRSLRRAPGSIFWGVLAGLAVVSGFAATQWIATESLDAVPVVSHTFSAPPGETLLWLMTASGATISFGVGSVFGVILGAFIGSLIKGHFRWEACEDPRELRRQIFGAALMGVGAVTAGGCTVGQGLSAFGLLAYSAPLTLLSIFAGAALGLKVLISGFAPDV